MSVYVFHEPNAFQCLCLIIYARVHDLIVAPTLFGRRFSHCRPKAAFVTLPSLHTQVPTSPSLTALACSETSCVRYTYFSSCRYSSSLSASPSPVSSSLSLSTGLPPISTEQLRPQHQFFNPDTPSPLFQVLSISAHNRIHLLNSTSTFASPTTAAMSWDDTGATAGL